MADQPDTVVTVDRDADPSTAAETQTIGPGEVCFVDGGVQRGTRVQATKPVQVHVGGGHPGPGVGYELRWFTLFPDNLLSADYLNPVGSSDTNQLTFTYLFNPNDTAITVTPTCAAGCGDPINLPAQGGGRYASPAGKAVRFESGGADFVAVGAVGSESSASPPVPAVTTARSTTGASPWSPPAC